MQLFAISLLSREMSLNVSLNYSVHSNLVLECKPFAEDLYGTVAATNTELNAKSWWKTSRFFFFFTRNSPNWAQWIIESSAFEQLHST